MARTREKERKKRKGVWRRGKGGQEKARKPFLLPFGDAGRRHTSTFVSSNSRLRLPHSSFHRSSRRDEGKGCVSLRNVSKGGETMLSPYDPSCCVWFFSKIISRGFSFPKERERASEARRVESNRIESNRNVVHETRLASRRERERKYLLSIIYCLLAPTLFLP